MHIFKRLYISSNELHLSPNELKQGTIKLNLSSNELCIPSNEVNLSPNELKLGTIKFNLSRLQSKLIVPIYPNELYLSSNELNLHVSSN